MATSLQYSGRPRIGIADVLLKDIARRIQLSPTNYRIAVQRYETIDAWLNREGGLLAPHMERLYPQGSMAIGATISSRLKNDEFDIDVIAELNLSPTIQPATVLDALFETMNGEKGTRYHGKVKRRTRCVSVEYEDMHLDITPAVLLPHRQDRTSVIFHAHENEPPEKHRRITANPWGFADWFENRTPAIHEIVEAVLRKTAEPVPDQDEVIEKSHPLVALQLLKRWRNKCYDDREGRSPPSVVLAFIVAMNPTGQADLYGEFRAQADRLHQIFAEADDRGVLVSVTNPACTPDDVFTDRWPGNLATQRVFLRDLEALQAKLDKIEADPTVETCAEVMSDLFGENPTRVVVEDFQKRFAAKAHAGGLYGLGGGSAGLALGSSGLAAKPLNERAYPIPRHTDFGCDG
jgi:hypothetical protein